MKYQEAIEYLYNSQPVFHLQGASAYKPGLGNTIKLMQELDNPHLCFKSIHVAGTNGKGSTCNMLAAILQSAGYKTGLYTSPHLVDYRERIRINGVMIGEEVVTRFIENNIGILERIHPSFFETTMAMAFWWFREEKTDVAVIETGLGGRLDSTNIISPCLSIITNIGIDHTEFLGNTLRQIATEKAGIIKPQTPVVIGEADNQTRPVFIDKARETNSEIVFASEQQRTLLPECQLSGIYQQKNICTTISAVETLRKYGWTIPERAVNHGLEHVCDLTGLQGRWQTIKKNGINYILDTGHNSHGISAYITQLTNIPNLHIIFGMVSDKDVINSLSLLPHSATYYFTQAQTSRAIDAESLKQTASNIGLQGEAYRSVKTAICEATKNAEYGDTIFIGGSNYVVGEALEILLADAEMGKDIV